MYTYIHVHTYVRTFRPCNDPTTLGTQVKSIQYGLNVYMHVCMYVPTYVCMYVHDYYMYVCMYVHMYTHIP